VCFADGIEDDRLALAWGQRVTVSLADNHLTLVVPAQPQALQNQAHQNQGFQQQQH